MLPRNIVRQDISPSRSVVFGVGPLSPVSSQLSPRLPTSLKTFENSLSARSSQCDPPFEDPMATCLGRILIFCGWFFICLTFPFSMFFCLRVVREYERAVLFRLGRLRPGGAQGPGLILVMPCIDSVRKVDLRVVAFDVPPQEILSKDSVTVTVDAVVYFRVSGPIISVTNVNDAFYSTKLLAQTTLRNILGTKTLSEMLLEREHIAEILEKVLDEGTDPWGIKVERVEMKDIRLPHELMRVMAAEAEATREAQAKVVAAVGEQQSSRALCEAARMLATNPTAMQLRYLQALNSIAAEHNSTIIFPLPVDIFSTRVSKNVPTSFSKKPVEHSLQNAVQKLPKLTLNLRDPLSAIWDARLPGEPQVFYHNRPRSPLSPLSMPALVEERDEELMSENEDAFDNWASQ